MNFVESLVAQYGLPAIFLLILAEYACFPVSSEIVLPLAGLMGAKLHISFAVLAVLSTVAGLIGSCITYGIGRFGGSPLIERLIRRFPSFSKPIDASYRTFGHRGKSAVFLSRLIPLCRTYIGFVAGAMKQPVLTYLISSALGILLWNTALTSLGYYFYQYKDWFFLYFDRYKKWIFFVGLFLLALLLLRRFKSRPTDGTRQEP